MYLCFQDLRTAVGAVLAQFAIDQLFAETCLASSGSNASVEVLGESATAGEDVLGRAHFWNRRRIPRGIL